MSVKIESQKISEIMQYYSKYIIIQLLPADLAYSSTLSKFSRIYEPIRILLTYFTSDTPFSYYPAANLKGLFARWKYPAGQYLSPSISLHKAAYSNAALLISLLPSTSLFTSLASTVSILLRLVLLCTWLLLFITGSLLPFTMLTSLLLLLLITTLLLELRFITTFVLLMMFITVITVTGCCSFSFCCFCWALRIYSAVSTIYEVLDAIMQAIYMSQKNSCLCCAYGSSLDDIGFFFQRTNPSLVFVAM